MSREKTTTGLRHWLLKTEPASFSFADLMHSRQQRTSWDGVRNYQARNFMRDDMHVGDLAFVYHSSAEPSGIVGIARITRAARPDPTQFDPADDHFDPKSKKAEPTWVTVEIEALRPFARCLTLAELKNEPRLARMLVVQRGQRLSVQPVTLAEWQVVLKLAGLDPADFEPPVSDQR